MAGKGSRPRPYSVDLNTFDNNWDTIFSKNTVDEHQDMQVAVDNSKKKFGSCGCGRSPTGNCCGWHGLSQEDYLAKLGEYNAQQNTQDTTQGS